MSNPAIALLEKYMGLLLCGALTLCNSICSLFFGGKPVLRSKKIVFVKFIEQGALILHQRTFKEAAGEYGAENIFLCTFSSNAQLADIIKLVPDENRIFIDERNLLSFTLGFLKALITIRKKNIDTVIDLEFFSRATAVFCYLTGAAKRAGYHRYEGLQNYRGNLFTHRLGYSHYVHVAQSGWSLLKSVELPVNDLPALNIEPVEIITKASFTPTANDISRTNQLLGYDISTRASVIINLSLNDVLPLRKWPAENYRQFVTDFKKLFPAYEIVFTGRADEYDLTDRFIAKAGLTNVINLCGKTSIRDVLTLYSYAKLLVTSDSGPAHFASLTSVHTIVLFGPETPVLYAPLSKLTHVMYAPPPCSPCYNVYNNRVSTCSNNVCMQRISVKNVMEKVTEIIDTN